MSKRAKRNSGSILFEFAIVVPVFLLLVLGGLDLLLATTAKSNLSYVAQETAAAAGRSRAARSSARAAMQALEALYELRAQPSGG